MGCKSCPCQKNTFHASVTRRHGFANMELNPVIKLNELRLSNNRLVGPIPAVPSGLVTFLASDNFFEGSLPHITYNNTANRLKNIVVYVMMSHLFLRLFFFLFSSLSTPSPQQFPFPKPPLLEPLHYSCSRGKGMCRAGAVGLWGGIWAGSPRKKRDIPLKMARKKR